jgi:hypothetical protein
LKVQLPVDSASAISQVGDIAALLDKNGWKAAAFIAVSCRPGKGGPRKPSTSGQLTFRQFADGINAKGWSHTIIGRHFDAWENAAEDGVVPHAGDLVFGEKVDVPADGWNTYYPPQLDNQHEDAEAIQTQAALDGTGASKAVDIAKNTKAMAAAIKASPKVAEAAAGALVDRGDVAALSKATAAAAANRQVERNRDRVAAGLGKAKPPRLADAEVTAFMSVKGLGDALRALVTTFPQEWAALPEEARTAEDFVAFCDETLDKILIAVSAIRTMLSPGLNVDVELQSILEGGE